ncbi:MAG: acyl-CoA dehydrogenase family protein [Myxococcales bacterium]|nr:acyl-CoA dehydrogenase family protein [Myxococcales bacterium]
MDFSLPPRVREVIGKINEFVKTELFPVENEFLQKPFREMKPLLAELRQKVKDLGYWAPQAPQEYGGMGLSVLEFAFISEVLGRSPIGHYVFGCQAPDAGNIELLIHFGTEEQKQRYLTPLLNGEIRSCFSMTEPDHPGANPTWMGTVAPKVDDNYVINGRKWFTTAADGAQFAIVMAVTDPDNENKYQRASMIIVPTDTPGFELVRNIPIMGDEGDDYNSHAEIQYTDCTVPTSNILGEEGAGFLLAQERLGPGRIHHCMRWLGICDRAFRMMCDRAAKRELSPGKPLGTRQTVQDWIAESRVEIHAARLMVLHAAWKIDQEGTYSAREEISMIKYYAAGVLQRVLDRAIQVHGALGITDDTPLSYWYRHERGARIYDGPDEVHRSVVAKRILRSHGMEL